MQQLGCTGRIRSIGSEPSREVALEEASPARYRLRHQFSRSLGASAGDVQARILMQTGKLALVGMTLGLAVLWIAARALQGLLFGVKFSDPVTFAAVLLLLVPVALLAGYFPARRASRLKPLDALRSE